MSLILFDDRESVRIRLCVCVCTCIFIFNDGMTTNYNLTLLRKKLGVACKGG